MKKITFRLVRINDNVPFDTEDTLQDVWSTIKFLVNDPRQWSVQEWHDEICMYSISALFIIENYKTSDLLPISLIEINSTILFNQF